MARDEGWLAEHMLILGVEIPQGEKTYVAAAFPERLRQDELRDADPARSSSRGGLEGHHRRRRHRLDQARRRTAGSTRSIPRPASSASRPARTQRPTPTRWRRITPNTIFTNVALTDDGDVWWEGMTDEPPAHLIDWQGNDWTPGQRHARRRTRTPASPRRSASARVIDPGVGRTRRACRSAAFIFGGRRATPMPLVYQAFNWLRRLPRRDDGLGDDRRGRRQARRGAPRPDGDAAVLRLQHGRLLRPLAELRPDLPNPPRIFSVNWFRKDERRQVPLARLRREHARPEVDRRPRRTAAPSASRARSAGCRATRTSTGAAWKTSPAEQFNELMSVDRDAWQQEIALARGAVYQAVRPAAQGAAVHPRADPLQPVALPGALGTGAGIREREKLIAAHRRMISMEADQIVCYLEQAKEEERDMTTNEPNIYRKTELVGTSNTGFDDAVRRAIERAQKTLRNVQWFEVKEQRGRIEGSAIEYQVTVEIGFALE